MTAAKLFIKCLENEGVQYVFGVPGEENLHLLEALRTAKVTFIPTRNEQAAGFMAATIGRLTGKSGVALSTLGPGATNFITAAAYANLGGMPALFITGQKPVKQNKQGAFQMVNTVSVMQPVTKFTHQIIDSATIPALVRQAFRTAEEERPGAVHLELPEDIAAERVQIEPLPVNPIRRPIAEGKAIKNAVAAIAEAKHPLLLIGAGANRKLTAKMLREFIDATGIPFLCTQLGKGVVDERHEKYIGTAALSAGDHVHCAVSAADLIINVGHDVVEKPPFLMTVDGAKVIHINFSPATIDPVYFPQIEVIGDIANSIWQIKEKLQPQPQWDFTRFERARNKLQEHITRDVAIDTFPLAPQRIVHDVRKALPDDGILCLDNGMYKLWFARAFTTYSPNTLLLDNALATMGAGLPSAIAAALLNPEKKVLAACGDGGFMMNAQEMETAVRLKLNLVILILNDNGFGMIQWKQHGMQLPDFGLSFSNPDFPVLATSFGATGLKVESAEALQVAITNAFAAGGVHLIEVPIDYSHNQKVLTDELYSMTC
jgi:acetolactate synthase-1/2/3 large subunit